MKKSLSYLILSLFIFSAVAQERHLALDECLALAYENNPSYKAGKLSVDKAATLKGSSFDAPNTGIELSQDATGGGSMENGLKFSQEFEFPTVYIAKRKVLKADYSLAQGELLEKKNQLTADVSSAYYSLVYAMQKVKILKELDDAYSNFRRIAQARYESGDASKLEAVNAGRLSDRCRRNLREAQGEVEKNSLLLANLIGLNEKVVPAEETLTVLTLPDMPETLDVNSTLHGHLFELMLNRSEQNLGLAKQEFMPGLFVAATTQLLIKGFNPYHVDRPRFEKGNFMGFQVGITVPLFFGAKRARLLAARQEVEITRLNNEAESMALQREYDDAKAQFALSRGSLDYYESEGIEQANEIARLAKVSYELGEIDYLEYIQNMETASEVILEYIECIDKYNQTIIRINTLKGTL